MQSPKLLYDEKYIKLYQKNDARIKSAKIDLKQIVIWSYVSRALKSVVLGLDKVYMMTHAPAVVKFPNGGTSQSWIGEINSQTAIRTRIRTRGHFDRA